MKILMFLENDFSSLQMDARVRKEAASLTKAGHEVTILVFDPRLKSRTVAIDGQPIKVVGLRYRPKRRLNSRQKRWAGLMGNKALARPFRLMEFIGFRKMQGAARAFNVALRIRADAYHANDYATLWLAALLSDLFRKPFVYDSHELWSDCWLQRPVDKKVIRFIESRFMPRASKVITVNGSIADIIASRYNVTRPAIVRNFPIARPLPRARILREKLNLPEDARIVMYVGAVKSDRGLGNLIEAARQMPETHFVIMGPGKITASESPNLHVLEAVPQAKVIDWLASADIGIHPMLNTEPNQYYSLGNKVGDYIMAGLPIAVSDFPEMRKLAVDEGLGAVFDPEDVGSMVNALKGLLEPDTYSQVKQNVLARRNDYTWANEEKVLLETYSGMVVR